MNESPSSLRSKPHSHLPGSRTTSPPNANSTARMYIAQPTHSGHIKGDQSKDNAYTMHILLIWFLRVSLKKNWAKWKKEMLINKKLFQKV